MDKEYVINKQKENVSLEESWLRSRLINNRHANELNDFSFVDILGKTKLDIFKKIQNSCDERTTLLKEWMTDAKLTNRWLLKAIKEKEGDYDGEIAWDAIKYSLLFVEKENKLQLQSLLLGLLKGKEDFWVNSDYRCHLLFRFAIYEDLKELQSFMLDRAEIDVNSILDIREVEVVPNIKYIRYENRPSSYYSEILGFHILLLAQNNATREMLLDIGANIFTKDHAPLAWGLLVSKNTFVPCAAAFARNLAATTLLPQSETPAEDVWLAFSRADTIKERLEMLKLGAKNGIWSLSSNKEQTKGKTTLMYLASEGQLLSEDIVKLVPNSAWGDEDAKGKTYFDYLYDECLRGKHNSRKYAIARDVQQTIPAEKYAKLVWRTITKKAEDLEIDDPMLVSPSLLSNIEVENRDNFWKSFFNNKDAENKLFEAIIASATILLVNETPFSVYKEDFSVWRKSLQWAKMDDGRRWIESSKKIADTALLLYLMETISLPKHESVIRRQKGLVRAAEGSSDETSGILADLYLAGGNIGSVLEEKEKVLQAYKIKVESINDKDKICLHKRNGQPENFDKDVLDTTPGLQALLEKWEILWQRQALNSIVGNKESAYETKVHQNAAL